MAEDDRGSLMRSWLIRFYMEKPFVPFIIRLEGGFELKVSTPEILSLEPGVLVASVYEGEDRFEVFPLDRVVSLKTLP
jgi:hypothetical protein